jgi:DNA-binding MarR family transcriptional regulator
MGLCKLKNKPLQALVQPFEQLRSQDSAMEVPTALVFIHVALQPGIKKTEIERQLNLTRSAAHRHIALLTQEGDVSRRGVDTRGLGLVVRKPDPKDGRAKRLYLTRKGEAFAQSLVDIVCTARCEHPSERLAAFHLQF